MDETICHDLPSEVRLIQVQDRRGELRVQLHEQREMGMLADGLLRRLDGLRRLGKED